MNNNLNAAPAGLQGQSTRFELRLWRLTNTLLAICLGLALAGSQGAILAGILSLFFFIGPEVWPSIACMLAKRGRP